MAGVNVSLWLIYIDEDGGDGLGYELRFGLQTDGEHVHIAQTRTLISTSYFCILQESESESESVSGNVNEALKVNSHREKQNLFLMF